MTASGDEGTVRKKKRCKFAYTKIEENTRTSGGGRYCEYCKIRKSKCSKHCIMKSGGGL